MACRSEFISLCDFMLFIDLRPLNCWTTLVYKQLITQITRVTKNLHSRDELYAYMSIKSRRHV